MLYNSITRTRAANDNRLLRLRSSAKRIMNGLREPMYTNEWYYNVSVCVRECFRRNGLRAVELVKRRLVRYYEWNTTERIVYCLFGFVFTPAVVSTASSSLPLPGTHITCIHVYTMHYAFDCVRPISRVRLITDFQSLRRDVRPLHRIITNDYNIHVETHATHVHARSTVVTRCRVDEWFSHDVSISGR